MPELKIEFEVFCSCGNGLCNKTTVDRRNDKITIEPCEVCLGKAKDEGHQEGYDKALQDDQESRESVEAEKENT